MLFLLPEELGFLRFLRHSGVPLNEYQFPANKIANVQSHLERIIERNYHLHKSSREAYKAFIHSYAAHSLKECYDVGNLDLVSVAKSFGFHAPPKVDLNLKSRSARLQGKKAKKGHQRDSGHAFSAANPYGKREVSDKRQFQR